MPDGSAERLLELHVCGQGLITERRVDPAHGLVRFVVRREHRAQPFRLPSRQRLHLEGRRDAPPAVLAGRPGHPRVRVLLLAPATLREAAITSPSYAISERS